MKIYTVEWRELVTHSCLVEADSVDDARDKLMEDNFTDDVVIDKEFYDTVFIDESEDECY